LGYFDGLVPHLVEDGLSILQYADDTIILLEDDLEKAKNLKLVLSAFERLSMSVWKVVPTLTSKSIEISLSRWLVLSNTMTRVYPGSGRGPYVQQG
jgi:hypothetical protein